MSFIDPASRLAFAWAVPTKHARHTRRALDRTLSLFPKPPGIVLSDNGSEFEAGFAEALGERGIRRGSTDPKTPKMNAHAERFNRTLAPSRSPSSTITRISSSPTSLSSTGSWPSGSCSPTPSGRTKDSTSHLRDPFSFTTNPSAQGGGLVHILDKDLVMVYKGPIGLRPSLRLLAYGDN